MKENKFVRFITSKYLVLIVQLIATAVFTYFIFVLNIIPLKHLIPITVILALLIIIFFIIMYSGQKKQKQGLRSKRGAITKIISLLLSIVLMIGTTYIMRS